MNSKTNVIDHIEEILQQKGHDADKLLEEAIGRSNISLRDLNAFSGTQPVSFRKNEYEKDIRDRRDIFITVVKDSVQNLSIPQREELFPALKDSGRKWLGQHITAL